MSRQRLDVKEAAEVLGISSEGVRKRIKRGNLESEKDSDGKVYVWLDVDRTESDNGRTTEKEALVEGLLEAKNETIAELRDRVTYLERQLDKERDANAENRRLLIAALERIPPQIEPPQETPPEPRESPETASEEPGKDDVPPEQEERLSWWRRLFGP